MEYWIDKWTCVMVGADGTVWVTKPSMFSGQIHTLEIPGVDAKELAEWMFDRANGKRNKLVQDQFPQVSDELREFLMTGITLAEWAKTFPPETDLEEEA